MIPPVEKEKRMLSLEIPGFGHVDAEYLIMDLNGTLGLEGVPDEGVIRRLRELSGTLSLIVLTADTHGHAKDLPADFGMKIEKLTPGSEDKQKQDFVKKMGSDKTITLGNGSNDALMLKESRIGICVIGQVCRARSTNGPERLPDFIWNISVQRLSNEV
jgi:soluble P-type ATPase